jgi:hypothetical protein
MPLFMASIKLSAESTKAVVDRPHDNLGQPLYVRRKIDIFGDYIRSF